MLETLCQICRQRPAANHLLQVKPDGGVLELHICPYCVASLQLDLHADPPDIDLILSGPEPSSSPQPDPHPSDTDAETACPECGLTWHEFRQRNLFGCPADYTAFGADLAAYLERLHGTDRHRGRRPDGGSQPDESERTALRELERQLKEAVAREEFERAADLRDAINRARELPG